MVRCGFNDYNTLLKWMTDLGRDAKKCLFNQAKNHAVYGRKIYSGNNELSEIRLYCDVYMTDEELDNAIMDNPHDVFYVMHK